MCIWKVSEEDRLCEYCSYRKGCEKYPVRESPEGMAGYYVEVMSEIIGRNVLDRSRNRDLVWGRNMIAYQLLRSGLSLSEVGRLLGMDHSTMHYCKGQVAKMLSMPSMYVREIDIWNQFQERIILNK